MAKNNALARITKRAKQIHKQSPGKKYTNCVKQAGSEYRAGKLGATLLLEKGETKRTKPKRVVQVKRSKAGTFKGMHVVGSINANKIKVVNDIQELVREQRSLDYQKAELKKYIKNPAKHGRNPNYKKQLAYIERLLKSNKKNIANLKRLV